MNLHVQKKFAVVLAGCGNKDGAEIQEAVLTLLAIDQQGGQYQCFAPDVAQAKVIDFLTDKPLPESRNVLVESARIARSQIKSLNEFNSADYDILVFPGGSGVAYNLCTYALEGEKMVINLDVEQAVVGMHHAKKPIGALCIAPVLVARLIPGVQVTFGDDVKANQIFATLGAKPINTTADSIIIDEANKVVTTPCYMLKTHPAQMFEGISKLISALIRLSK